MGKQSQRKKKKLPPMQTVQLCQRSSVHQRAAFFCTRLGICAVENVNVDKGGVSDGICIFYR